MSEIILRELKALRKQRGEFLPFASHTGFLIWSDAVRPLLSFELDLQRRFSAAVTNVEVYHQQGVEYPMQAINDAIGICNQGIGTLELRQKLGTLDEPMVTAERSELPPPERLTLKWMWDNATWTVWSSLLAVVGGAISLAFGLGVWIDSHFLKN